MLDAKHKVQYKRGMANVLPLAKRAQILGMLCEGMSMRATSRLADVSINTVSKLLEDAGEACLWLHDDLVVNVKASKIQVDEIWSFCYAKEKNVAAAKSAPEGAGNAWTFTAIDAETKLIVAYQVADRNGVSARVFLRDLERRLSNRVQLTTDGHSMYLSSVTDVFQHTGIDYAMLDKIYGKIPTKDRTAEARYSPPKIIGTKRRRIAGNPDEAHVSTSHVERSNLSIRMQNRRFTRLTNGFSKKLDNHIHMLALYFAFYNFCRIHKTLRVTPAMAAGITDKLWSFEDLIARIDHYAPPPKPRGPYKKRGAA
jgi:IS1 family transposase